MKTFLKKANKIHYMHYIAAATTLGFVAVSIFIFPKGIIRVKESFIDLWYSLLYYIEELIEVGINVRPTVNDYSVVPFTPIFNLPETWEEFVLLWNKYWELFITKTNLQSYFSSVGDTVGNTAKFILIAGVPLFLIVFMLFRRYLTKHNNDYNRDSKPLQLAKQFGEKVYLPVKRWIQSYVAFLRENDKHYKLWLLIWCYNFNVIVMGIEFVAFYLYFVVAFDFLNIYRQIYKLLCDLSVSVAFLPVWVWFCLGMWIFLHVRKKIALQILRHHEAMNCGFINERPIVTMTCGTMGKKKTTMITDMMLLQEKMFRDKALELMLENDLKFPNFPWVNLENYIKACMRQHRMFSLATIKQELKHLRRHFIAALRSDAGTRKAIRRHLKKRHAPYPHANCIFDYDYEKYGMTYDDKLKVIEIWSVIEAYAQEYFVYVLKSSIIISNFSVRTDPIVSDLGNLPMRDSDFYSRNSKFIYEISRYAKIIDYNALRLGRKLGEEDPKKDSFEFGVAGTTEVGKERKNNLQLQELKKKDDSANQKNDGFNDWLKMIRHSATIDFIPFVKVFTDEQRPESWGADARDLCEIIHIKDGGSTRLALPFFALEELLYSFVYDKFANLYLQYRHIRADNTLPMYIFKKLMGIFQRYYKNVYNMYGFSKMKVQVESGTQDGELAEKAYYLDNKRIYSDRFSTDCFSDFFTTKSLRSSVGFDDLEEYESSKATLEELKMQNSYFVADLVQKQENDV